MAKPPKMTLHVTSLLFKVVFFYLSATLNWLYLLIKTGLAIWLVSHQGFKANGNQESS